MESSIACVESQTTCDNNEDLSFIQGLTFECLKSLLPSLPGPLMMKVGRLLVDPYSSSNHFTREELFDIKDAVKGEMEAFLQSLTDRLPVLQRRKLKLETKIERLCLSASTVLSLLTNGCETINQEIQSEKQIVDSMYQNLSYSINSLKSTAGKLNSEVSSDIENSLKMVTAFENKVGKAKEDIILTKDEAKNKLDEYQKINNLEDYIKEYIGLLNAIEEFKRIIKFT